MYCLRHQTLLPFPMLDSNKKQGGAKNSRGESPSLAGSGQQRGDIAGTTRRKGRAHFHFRFWFLQPPNSFIVSTPNSPPFANQNTLTGAEYQTSTKAKNSSLALRLLF